VWWRYGHVGDYGGLMVGDGSNLEVYNGDTLARRVVMFRMGYTKPNPPPRTGRRRLYGTYVIVLERDDKGFIFIAEAAFNTLCEDLFEGVAESKRKGEPHPLIGKTLREAILEDVDDKMGYGKYKALLSDLGLL